MNLDDFQGLSGNLCNKIMLAANTVGLSHYKCFMVSGSLSIHIVAVKISCYNCIYYEYLYG